MNKKVKKVEIPKVISVRKLSEVFEASVADIISVLMKYGVRATINEEVDFETASIIADDFGISVKPADEKENFSFSVEEILKKEKAANLVERPPIVTVMGHVDHGKTSLLDAIRQTDVALKESGLITQHIGAYQVEMTSKGEKNTSKKITFIDTPGHEAFAAIRARGASVTDIAILVVDASDGVRPQTLEAIQHARSASVPIIVAITKIDKPDADVEKVKKELSECDLTCEDWGGKTICVPVSSKTKEGIDELLEMILLVAEMEELKANPQGQLIGTVIESRIESGKGPVATVLIQNGTLEVGQPIICGRAFGRVRAIENFKGRKIKQAGPGTPAKILGIRELPVVGDIIYAVKDELEAKRIANQILRSQRVKRVYQPEVKKIEEKEDREARYKLKLILKADVVGSLEALHSSLLAIGNKEAKVDIISEGVGDVSESDVMMAETTGAEIFGFHISVDEAAKRAAKTKNIKIYLFDVIYDLIDKAYKKLEAMLPPEVIEETLGSLRILQIFGRRKNELIVGGKVEEGKIVNKTKIRIIRNNEVIGEGKILNLQIQKKDTSEVSLGKECGLLIESDLKLQEGDILECYRVEERPKKL